MYTFFLDFQAFGRHHLQTWAEWITVGRTYRTAEGENLNLKHHLDNETHIPLPCETIQFTDIYLSIDLSIYLSIHPYPFHILCIYKYIHIHTYISSQLSTLIRGPSPHPYCPIPLLLARHWSWLGRWVSKEGHRDEQLNMRCIWWEFRFCSFRTRIRMIIILMFVQVSWCMIYFCQLEDGILVILYFGQLNLRLGMSQNDWMGKARIYCCIGMYWLRRKGRTHFWFMRFLIIFFWGDKPIFWRILPLNYHYYGRRSLNFQIR